MGLRGPVSKKRVATQRANGPVRKLPDDADKLFRRMVRDNPALSAMDAGLVEQYAQALLLQRWAFAELAKPGADGEGRNLLERDTTHGDGTEKRRHPMWIAWRTAAEQLRAAAQQLGATPMARARLPEPETAEMSLADMLFAEASAHNE